MQGGILPALDHQVDWDVDADGIGVRARTADILTVLGDGLLVASHLDKPTNLRELIRDAMTAVLDGRRPASPD